MNVFVAVFKANALPRIEQESKVYIWLTNLLNLLQNNLKNCQETVVIVFGIKIGTARSTARLSADKLGKAVKVITKVLSQKTVNFLNIQSLVRFFSFCFQAVKLGRVFMRRL